MNVTSLKEMKKSTSLPLITKKYKILSEESKKELLLFTSDTLSQKTNKISEIKIYLSDDFNRGDIDNEFMKDIENEYAEQYLSKMELFPTRKLIQKLLKIKPIESCDFHLGNEVVYINEKPKETKVIHIYPSSTENNIFKSLNLNKKKNNNNNIINKKIQLNHVESIIKFNKKKKDPEKEAVSNIKKINKHNENDLVFNKEKVDSMLLQAKEGIIEAKYFNTKNIVINVDLSPDNIRQNYVIYKKNRGQNAENRFFNGRGRFNNISKSVSLRKNILNDPKYIFPVNTVEHLTKEILAEINEPMETKIEIIIKDMNYILDNFPIDDFINIGKTKEKEKVGEDNSNFLYKINLDEYNDILEVLKILHSPTAFKLVGLTLNLIYWIVFGNENNIQIDSNTKQLIYLKILKEIELLVENIKNTKILYEVLLPLLIIMIRIEADVYFSRKFTHLFKNKENKKKSMNLINEIITEIYDKHGYMNSFVTVAGKSKELKEKMNKNLLPRFKNKLFATSNYIEQIFNNDTSDILKKVDEEGGVGESQNEIEQRKNFIAEQKISFFSDFLNKINNNLTKRHLKPIFSVRRIENDEFKNISTNSSMINVKRFKTPLNKIIHNNKNINNISDINNIKNNININNISNINKHINIDNINERYKTKNENNNNYNMSNNSTETKNTILSNDNYAKE